MLDRSRSDNQPENGMLVVGSWQLVVVSWELGVGSWELGVGSWQLGVTNIEIQNSTPFALLNIVVGIYNELTATATAVAIVWFEWGTATQSNGESLVRIQHCPATVNRTYQRDRVRMPARGVHISVI